MWRHVSEVFDMRVEAVDGLAGRVRDLRLDDRTWRVTHLVVVPRRGTVDAVLVPPAVVSALDRERGRLEVELTVADVRRCPDAATHPPVSRQRGLRPYHLLGIPFRWGDADPAAGRLTEPDLRSARALVGYHVEDRDGDAGRVDDFLMDDRTWVVHYVVVAVGPRWRPRPVLVPTARVVEVSGAGALLRLDLERAALAGGSGPGLGDGGAPDPPVPAPGPGRAPA